MLIEAFKYKRWADLRALEAIQRIDGRHFPAAVTFARQQLNHMIRVEELFKARLLGAPAPHRSTNTELVPEFSELAQRINDSNQWFLNYAGSLEQGDRHQTVSFQFVDGKCGTMTRLEILFHIVNHGTYHRGSIAHGLDMAGVAHPTDAYTVFIHELEPKRRRKMIGP
jgi:uncharacterized damage-inducible protein DinB